MYLQNKGEDAEVKYFLWAAGFVIKNLPTPTYVVAQLPPLSVKFYNLTTVDDIAFKMFICEKDFSLKITPGELYEFGVLFDKDKHPQTSE